MQPSIYLYATLSAIFAALVAILGKVGLAGVDSTLATTIRSVVMAAFLVVISLTFGKFSSISTIDSKAILCIVLSGVAGALSWLFYFFAIKAGKVSAVVAIDRTSVAIALALAVVFLGEALTWQKAAGAILIVGGAILVAL